MKYKYDEPREIYIFFTPRKDGTCKKYLQIERCIGFKTGKEIVIEYLAKDEKVHRHKYPNFQILLITSESEVMYESKTSTK